MHIRKRVIRMHDNTVYKSLNKKNTENSFFPETIELKANFLSFSIIKISLCINKINIEKQKCEN